MLNSNHKSAIEIFDSLYTDIKGRTGYPKYPCGVKELDDLMWGLHKKELLVIGARPSHGKTSLALNLAWNLAKKKHGVIFVSLEMSKESIIERIMCQELNINGWKLRKGFQDEILKVEKQKDYFNQVLISTTLEVIDYKGKTIKDIKDIIEEFKPEFIFIDHAQKISQSGYGNKYEALSDYVNTLQNFAIKYNIGIILNSQINRAGSQEKNATDYFKGSGEIEESADTLLHCKWVVRDNPQHGDPKEYHVSVLKQRHGACDFASINFDAGTFKFSSRISEDQEVKKVINTAKKIFFHGGLKSNDE